MRSRRAQQKDGGLGDGHPLTRWRLPAGEIETVVLRLLQEVLGDASSLRGQLPRSVSLADEEALSARLQLLREQLERGDPLSRRGLLLSLVDRVVPAEGSISLVLRVSGLAGTRNGPETAAAEMIEVSRAVSLRRRGLETRLIIEGSGPAEPEPDPALIKALAQAHRWWRDLLERRYATMRELAQAYATDESYVGRILPLAFLDPGLTTAIIAGRQPPEFTLHRFLHA